MPCRLKIGSSFVLHRFALKITYTCFSAYYFTSGCPNGYMYMGNECKQKCRYQNYDKECKILCICNSDFCDHINGCDFSKIFLKIVLFADQRFVADKLKRQTFE